MVQRVRPVLSSATPVILRDGTTARLRAASPDDIERLRALFTRASLESLWLRFFTSAKRVDQRDLERMIQIDGVERMTYVITRGEGAAEQILAVGNYVRLPRWDTAEVAFFVDDAFQGKGLGTLLLERLAAHALQQGIVTLIASVLPDNHRMLDVFRKSGFAVHVEWDQGAMRVELPATPSEAALAQSEARERSATTASLIPFFKPQSVAVIEAAREARTMGRMVFERLLNAEFEGPVYPVNPTAKAVAAVRAFPAILDVPDEVDLAIITVPAEETVGVVEACIRKRVRALVVLSAGFAEAGPEGRARQEAVLQKVRTYGLRLLGPNCAGLLNTDPQVRLNATVGAALPSRGSIAISSQSGAVGLAILRYIKQLGLGVASFVEVGNKADVSGNDLLQYWEEDPAVQLIMLYLESFGNPRKFARIARRVSRRKPILAVKSGWTSAAARAARSHTAALAISDQAVDALFHQAGVIRADTLEELFDIALVLANQPLPAGNRVAIVTNASGPGVLCADVAATHGLLLSPLAPDTRASLQTILSTNTNLENPVTLTPSASPHHYEAVVQRLLADSNVDALIVISAPVELGEEENVAQALQRAVATATETEENKKPVLTCFLSSPGLPAVLSGSPASATAFQPLPSYRFPEPAAKALARAVLYAEWRRRPLGQFPSLSRVDVAAARAIVHAALQTRGEGWLQPEEAVRLLAAAGIPTPGFTSVATWEEVSEAATRLGLPVTLKPLTASASHGPISMVTLRRFDSAGDAQQAAQEMWTRSTEPLTGFFVQQARTAGAKVFVRVVDDPDFGPLIGFGLGGTEAEVLQDTVFRITPLTDVDAREMVRAIRGLPLLLGYREQPKADVEAIEDLLLRISWLVEELPEIGKMDLHPISVLEPGRGLMPLDVWIYIRR